MAFAEFPVLQLFNYIYASAVCSVFPRQLTTFKGDAKAIKLFAKHIKVQEMTAYYHARGLCTMTSSCQQFSFCFVLSVQIEEQVKLLQKGVTHIGVGTPGRISALIEKGRQGRNVPAV